MKPWSLDAPFSRGPAAFGAETLSAAIQDAAGYAPKMEKEDARCIHLGLDAALPEGAYRLRVEDAPAEGQQVWISGRDEAALMHGCMDFAYDYMTRAAEAHSNGNPYYFHPLFGERPLPPVDRVSVPAVQSRGLWMWGHVVYDYRALFRNMARLKLNEIILWNDDLPANHRQVVEAAHALGIRVIWGFAWGWDTGTTRLDLSDDAALAAAADGVVEKYRREYAASGADGLYFQSFTETDREELNGRLIAQTVVEWVNGIARRLYSEYPGLRLQFGLHATSVSRKLQYIAQTDPRIHIIWEDCGDFPYAYVPTAPKDPAGTEAFTRKMLALRPGTVNGAVLKGMICLDWGKFVHPRGPRLLGCAGKEALARRLEAVKPVWRYVQAGWMAHGEACRKTVEMLAAQPAELYALAEDGALEAGMPLPVALFAAICWDPQKDYGQILREAATRPDVVFY